MAYRILSIRAQIRPNWEVQLTYISFPSYLLCRFMLYFFDIFMSKITSDKTAGKQFSLILVCWSTDIYGKVQKQSRKENCKKQQKSSSQVLQPLLMLSFIPIALIFHQDWVIVFPKNIFNSFVSVYALKNRTNILLFYERLNLFIQESY